MLTFKSWIKLLTEASSEDTTFFHEVICAIACFSSTEAGKIKRGADIKQFFDNKSIIAKGPGAGEGTDITDITGHPFFKFVDDSTIPVAVGQPASTELNSKEASEDYFKSSKMGKRKDDAIAVAKAIVKRIGSPTGTVYWTGPTNDSTDYGAADIAYNGQGISLKFGAGQFKNLTVNQFARAALGAGSELKLLTELHKSVPEKWDKMTGKWMKLIEDALNLSHWSGSDELGRAGREARNAFGQLKNSVRGWDSYQKLKVGGSQAKIFNRLLYKGKKAEIEVNRKESPKHPFSEKRAKEFRYVCRKIYEDKGVSTSLRNAWRDVRNDQFTNIFGTYFSNEDETIKENLHTVFEKQISVGEKPMLYAAKGGTDIKRVPSKAEFEAAIQNIDFTYEGVTTGAGYTFILNATQRGSAAEAIKIMEITIFFRWKSAGQMYGNPDTSSKSQMFITDYTLVFPEIT